MTKQEAIATNLINLAMNRRSSESRAKPRLSYAESRRKWAKAKDGSTLKGQDGHVMTMTGLSIPVNREAA